MGNQCCAATGGGQVEEPDDRERGFTHGAVAERARRLSEVDVVVVVQEMTEEKEEQDAAHGRLRRVPSCASSCSDSDCSGISDEAGSWLQEGDALGKSASLPQQRAALPMDIPRLELGQSFMGGGTSAQAQGQPEPGSSSRSRTPGSSSRRQSGGGSRRMLGSSPPLAAAAAAGSASSPRTFLDNSASHHAARMAMVEMDVGAEDGGRSPHSSRHQMLAHLDVLASAAGRGGASRGAIGGGFPTRMASASSSRVRGVRNRSQSDLPPRQRPASARRTPRAKAEEQTALDKQLHKQQMQELQSQDSEEDEEGEGGEKAKGNHKRVPPQGYLLRHHATEPRLRQGAAAVGTTDPYGQQLRAVESARVRGAAGGARVSAARALHLGGAGGGENPSAGGGVGGGSGGGGSGVPHVSPVLPSAGRQRSCSAGQEYAPPPPLEAQASWQSPPTEITEGELEGDDGSPLSQSALQSSRALHLSDSPRYLTDSILSLENYLRTIIAGAAVSPEHSPPLGSTNTATTTSTVTASSSANNNNNNNNNSSSSSSSSQGLPPTASRLNARNLAQHQHHLSSMCPPSMRTKRPLIVEWLFRSSTFLLGVLKMDRVLYLASPHPSHDQPPFLDPEECREREVLASRAGPDTAHPLVASFLHGYVDMAWLDELGLGVLCRQLLDLNDRHQKQLLLQQQQQQQQSPLHRSRARSLVVEQGSGEVLPVLEPLTPSKEAKGASPQLRPLASSARASPLRAPPLQGAAAASSSSAGMPLPLGPSSSWSPEVSPREIMTPATPSSVGVSESYMASPPVPDAFQAVFTGE